jgi:hypothetical protein
MNGWCDFVLTEHGVDRSCGGGVLCSLYIVHDQVFKLTDLLSRESETVYFVGNQCNVYLITFVRSSPVHSTRETRLFCCCISLFLYFEKLIP